MKQLTRLFLTVATVIALSACGSADNELGIESSSSAAESTTSETVTTESTSESTESSEPSINGEVYSGTLIVGEDIEPGKYDIAPDGVDASIEIFENQEAVGGDESEFEWLFEGDILKSYTLREGNVIEIDGNMIFSKK